ncbi:MAG TPA: hypothetical protein VMT12_07160 [Syntrophales bacterium]|nr:hypothetical protein [Syntrophales bacterium]
MREKQFFFDHATQYYVVARFSAFSGLLPVSGNLFHHAIEMYLKGYLVSKLTLPELKSLGHRLQEIWNRCKKEIADAELDKFDQVISELDKFESIRYPDQILSQGMIGLINVKKQHGSAASVAPKRLEPKYEIVIEEIDSLVKVIFQKSSINPEFFINSLKPEVKSYLNKDNESPLL